MKKQTISILVGILALLVASIGSGGLVPRAHAQGSAGAVYIMNNSPAGNQVILYNRAADGSLTLSGKFATKGLGLAGLTGTNQGGLALSKDGRWLFVVNAGSDDLSVFRVGSTGLTFTDKVSSGGSTPVSVTVFGSWVYVLNNNTAAKPGNIAGFSLSEGGQLSSIPGSTPSVSGKVTVAQISFNPTGTSLAVTEKSSSLIDIYAVNSQGVASGPTTSTSSGATPFGFAFEAAGQLIVSEAGGGPAGTSAVSSYSITSTGSLTTISASVPDSQLAACWLVVTGNSRYAYTANAHSGTISGYAISPGGSLTLLPTTTTTGAGDLDMALSRNSQFLYVFVKGSQSIEEFSVHSDGSLGFLTMVTGVLTTDDGLAAN